MDKFLLDIGALLVFKTWIQIVPVHFLFKVHPVIINLFYFGNIKVWTFYFKCALLLSIHFILAILRWACFILSTTLRLDDL